MKIPILLNRDLQEPPPLKLALEMREPFAHLELQALRQRYGMPHIARFLLLPIPAPSATHPADTQRRATTGSHMPLCNLEKGDSRLGGQPTGRTHTLAARYPCAVHNLNNLTWQPNSRRIGIVPKNDHLILCKTY